MAKKRGTLLNTIDGFPEAAARQLAELWITTAEELVGAARREEGPRGLAEFLGATEGEVADLVGRAEAAVPPTLTFAAADIQRHGLGALDEPEEEEAEEEAVAFATLPAQVDLHDRMPPVRDQGGRGTCVAFACVAVREYLLGGGSTEGDFSEQFLYWACKERDLFDGEGTWIRTGMAALKNEGVCVEAAWPYNSSPIPGSEGQGPPPAGATEDAADHLITDFRRLRARWVDTLRGTLAEGKPVVFAVPVYTYWFTEPVRSTGDIRLPLSTDKVEGGHALCMVGYEDDPDVPGGGYFAVRNSWGTSSWGHENAIAPGHARIPYAFMKKVGRSAFIASVEPVEEGSALIRWLINLWKWLTGQAGRRQG